MTPNSEDTYCHRAEATRGIVRRLVWALVLVPIVPAGAIIGTEFAGGWFGSAPFDELRWFNLLVAVLTVGLSVLIWRTVIIWTMGRSVLTGLVAMIPFVQVIHGQPLWNAGCVGNDLLRLGQGQFGVGVWVWLTIWVWWGWERLGAPAAARRRQRMTPTAKRIVAAIGTLPFSVGLFFVVLQVWDGLIPVPSRYVPALTYATTAVITVAVWLHIWRAAVAWNRLLVNRTLLAAGLLLGLPIAATIFFEDFGSPVETALGFMPVIGWGLWMAGTVWYWPFRASGSDADRYGPRCPQCGYLLTGLRATRCPECGNEPTLDDLWAATMGGVLEYPPRP